MMTLMRTNVLCVHISQASRVKPGDGRTIRYRGEYVDGPSKNLYQEHGTKGRLTNDKVLRYKTIWLRAIKKMSPQG